MNIQKEYDELIERMNRLGYKVEDGVVSEKESKGEGVLCAEVYHRYETDYESYGYFNIGRSFIRLVRDEEVYNIDSKDKIISFLEGNEDGFPDYVYEVLEVNCWDVNYFKEADVVKKEWFAEKDQFEYPNDNGFREEFISEFSLKGRCGELYVSIFKTDKETFKSLSEDNFEVKFDKYIKEN